MLIRNDVLLYAGPASRAIRILWIDPGRTMAASFALGVAGAWPVLTPLRLLEADVQNRRARLLLCDPYAARPAPAPTPAQLAAHDRAGAVIHALMCSSAAIFHAQERRRMVAEVAAAHGLSAATVHRYLRRYWEGGQSPDALWPDDGSAAAPGKPAARRGAVQAEPDVRSNFRMAVTRYASTHSAFSRRAAYRQMLEDFYPERTIDALPTFGQFNYWIDKDAVLQSI
jgi:transposase-like protein